MDGRKGVSFRRDEAFVSNERTERTGVREGQKRKSTKFHVGGVGGVGFLLAGLLWRYYFKFVVCGGSGGWKLAGVLVTDSIQHASCRGCH